MKNVDYIVSYEDNVDAGEGIVIIEGKGKKGYVCKVCGWIYEGEELPEDIVCPLCKHGAADFEKLE